MKVVKEKIKGLYKNEEYFIAKIPRLMKMIVLDNDIKKLSTKLPKPNYESYNDLTPAFRRKDKSQYKIDSFMQRYGSLSSKIKNIDLLAPSEKKEVNISLQDQKPDKKIFVRNEKNLAILNKNKEIHKSFNYGSYRRRIINIQHGNKNYSNINSQKRYFHYICRRISEILENNKKQRIKSKDLSLDDIKLPEEVNQGIVYKHIRNNSKSEMKRKYCKIIINDLYTPNPDKPLRVFLNPIRLKWNDLINN